MRCQSEETEGVVGKPDVIAGWEGEAVHRPKVFGLHFPTSPGFWLLRPLLCIGVVSSPVVLTERKVLRSSQGQPGPPFPSWRECFFG